MKTEGRGQFIAIFACIAFYLGYTFYLQKKYPDMGKPKPKAVESTEMTGGAIPSSTGAVTNVAEVAVSAPNSEGQALGINVLSAEELRIETSEAIFTFDQNQAAIRTVQLKKYRSHSKGAEKSPIQLLDSPSIVQLSRDFSQIKPATGISAERKSDQSIAFSRQDGDWLLTWEYLFKNDSYAFELVGTVQNLSAQPQELNAGFFIEQSETMGPSPSMFNPSIIHKRIISGINGSRSAEVDMNSHCTEESSEAAASLKDAEVNFFGIDDHYFLRVFQPLDKGTEVYVQRVAKPVGPQCQIISKTLQRFGMVGPQGQVRLNYRGYYGPKDVSVLETHDVSLKQAVNFGFFSILARPLLLGIEAAYKLAQNYGVAIIIVTFFLKILFYPLTRRAAVSMKRMQKLQPEMKKIQEKFKDDPPTMQRELMKFMSTNKANPFQGCLPILPQIPVFIAFYNVLSQAIELRHAPFFGWIQDLSAADPYYITPILLAVAMFVQQKLTPTPGMDKTQERIMMMMPIVFSLMMLSLPAGMVLYMITNTIVSIAQQQWLNHRLKNVAA